ncbi:MAG TPA: translocation/assembly module TamB domain-containing protein, partial [Paludibacteraceae bacterium]|nr:translocation/assembly module TamB domain-containing protein [Paludibacteraceae bacterium]
MNIDNFSYQNYKFNDFEATADYEKKFLTANVKMIPQDSGQLLIKGKLPMQFRLDTMQFGLLSKKTDPVDLQLSIEKFPLTVLHMFLPKAEIDGFIESNVAVNGTVSEPNLEGQLNITDGKLLWKQYGINYPTILTNLEFQNNNIKLDTFLIKSQKGFMLATGNVKLIPPLNNLKINDAGMKVEFNNFEPISHKYYNMELSGNASLATNQDSSYFSGEVTIPRSEFYLPALMRLIGQTSVPEMPKPLLVEEIEKMQAGDSLIIKLRPDTSKQVSKKSSVMLPNLQGNIRVKIPHNTWIKDDNMRLELSGDVEFMKHYNFFELFGSVEVVRGQYNLLGKVFVVESGTVTFAGGEKINPILDLKASYTFHDQARAQRKLVIQVTGETSSPEIAFTLDDELISEGDAVSYILFGTQLDAISFDQQATINEGLNSSDLA